MDFAPRDWKPAAAVVALLALHVALALWAVSGKSVTADEILHVTGGFFYDRYGDFRIQPENGNLPQRIAGLPAVLMGAPPPPLAGNVYWQTSDASVVAHQFFYETGHNHWPMLMAARALVMIFSIGTGLLVFGWARALFGTTPGLLALTFYALDPNVLAHAPLATSDSAAVFFLLASVTAFWAHLRTPGWRTGALSAFVFGLACVAKYSAVLLLPMFASLLIWRIARDGKQRRWWRLGPAIVIAHALGAWLVIWTFFNARYSGCAPTVPAAAHYIVPWDGVLPFIGWQGRFVEFLREHRLLPEAFLYGYSWVIQSAKARSAFLAGQYSVTGWVSFFPSAFWWKTTLALLATLPLGAWALVLRWRRGAGNWRDDGLRIAPLFALFTVYWAFSLMSHLNIGHRHILPTYPVLFILAGGLALRGVLPGIARQFAVLLLVVLAAAENYLVAPDYLAFFNQLAGGPANGHRLLVDSSLDWGQDLPSLKSWLENNNTGPDAQPVFLSYFGSGEPHYYRIEGHRLLFVNGFKIRQTWYQPTSGLYCISATMLSEVYNPMRGEWTSEKEAQYQNLRRLDGQFRQYLEGPAASESLFAFASRDQWDRAWGRYENLRHVRLCAYLRARRPNAVIGYSLLIYRLSDDEIERILNRNYSDWLEAIISAPR